MKIPNKAQIEIDDKIFEVPVLYMSEPSNAYIKEYMSGEKSEYAIVGRNPGKITFLLPRTVRFDFNSKFYLVEEEKRIELRLAAYTFSLTDLTTHTSTEVQCVFENRYVETIVDDNGYLEDADFDTTAGVP